MIEVVVCSLVMLFVTIGTAASLGTHEAGRIRCSRRSRGGCRRDGPVHLPTDIEVQHFSKTLDRDQQIGRRRSRRVYVCQRKEGGSPYGDHHPIESLHNPSRNRRSFQLERSHTSLPVLPSIILFSGSTVKRLIRRQKNISMPLKKSRGNS